ncbi:hypothetical protein C8Q74DRAFT_1283706 [Fomes fomentarius]|nr:hypothetical protein C8Q74DRAFT_1283706 [Fomes fomentarius]
MHKPQSIRSCVAQVRYASTSAGPYPFPAHSRPTPHQIFHLPIGASQKEIKARYYELVRVHHPDAPNGYNLSPEVRRSRFQAITAAYDTLRGKWSGGSSNSADDIYRQELDRRRRARAAYEASLGRGTFSYEQTPGKTWEASADDRWKDRIILFIGIMALGAGLGPMLVWPSYQASHQAHLSASRNLAAARREAREYGEERRRAISERVKEFKAQEAQAEQNRPSELDASRPSSASAA